MTIKQIEVTVGDVFRGYVNNDEQGVRGYDGKFTMRMSSGLLLIQC